MPRNVIPTIITKVNHEKTATIRGIERKVIARDSRAVQLSADAFKTTGGALRFSLEHRRREVASLAAYHVSKARAGAIIRPGSVGAKVTYVDPDGKVMTMDDVGVATWHEALAEKYRPAAHYP